MKTITLETAERVSFNLDGRIMFSDKRVELVHLALQPNEEIALHSNPFDVVFYTLEGEGVALYEDQQLAILPHMSIFIEKDKQRGLLNNSSSMLRVLVIKIF